MEKVFKSNDLVSIVIPIYNVEKYLKKCIDSVLNQTYSNLDIILVDDGSPDNCGDICDRYAACDQRIKVIHQQNAGLSAARNSGIKKAIGKYISFIDSDDYIDLNYVEVLLNCIKKYNADISIAGHTVIYENGKIIKRITEEEYSCSPKDALLKILYDDGIDLSAWSKLYKTSLFENINFPVGRLFEDSATTYKLIDAAQTIAVNSISIYNYLIRSNSITSNKFSDKKLDLIISTKEMTDYIEKKYPDLKKACERRLMYAYLSSLSQFAKSDVKNDDILYKLTSYIKKNQKSILKDKKVPKRDKFAIISLLFGFKFYKFIWKLYSKLSGRV